METVNQRISLVRKSLHLTLAEFSSKISRATSTVSEYEKDGKSITDRVIDDICREFYVNESWLRTGEGDMFRARNSTNEELALQVGKLLKVEDEFTKNLFLEYLKLPPEMKKLMRDFVHQLAEKDSKSK